MLTTIIPLLFAIANVNAATITVTDTIWDIVTVTEIRPATIVNAPLPNTPAQSTTLQTVLNTPGAVQPASSSSTNQVSSPSVTAGQYSGDGTFYELGLTACGQTYTDNDMVAAISYKLFDQNGTPNPNNNPHCGQKITVFRAGKSVQVTIVDRCAGCEGMYNVDLSPAAFNQLGTPAEGRIPVTWSYA